MIPCNGFVMLQWIFVNVIKYKYKLWILVNSYARWCILFVTAGYHCVVALGKILTPVCLCDQAVQFFVLALGCLPSVAEKATIGLASPWPCVTDLMVYPPMGSWPKEGTWAPWLCPWSMAWFTFTFMMCYLSTYNNCLHICRYTVPTMSG